MFIVLSTIAGSSFRASYFHNQNNYSAKNNLAISYKNIFNYSKAIDLLTELIKKFPKYVNAFTNLANIQNETYFF